MSTRIETHVRCDGCRADLGGFVGTPAEVRWRVQDYSDAGRVLRPIFATTEDGRDLCRECQPPDPTP